MTVGSWALRWSERPTEMAALFNPAFCGELLARCVADHEGTRGEALPVPLGFVVLPLVLHPATRRILPGRANTAFATWAAANRAALVDLGPRTLALRPASREGLLFLAQRGFLSVTAGGIATGDSRLRLSAVPSASTPDIADARRAAAFLGRWFANQGRPAFVLQSLGVRP